MRGLRLQVECLGRGELHPCRELVAADTGVEPLVAFARGGVLPVEVGHQPVSRRLAVGRDKLPGRVGEQIGDRSLGPRKNDRAAVLRG